jgi:hypothetical protein
VSLLSVWDGMDMRTYFQELSSKLNTINDIVYENAKASGQQMEEKGQRSVLSFTRP